MEIEGEREGCRVAVGAVLNAKRVFQIVVVQLQQQHSIHLHLVSSTPVSVLHEHNSSHGHRIR